VIASHSASFYTKQFGDGRVFYHAGGHELEEMERPKSHDGAPRDGVGRALSG